MGIEITSPPDMCCCSNCGWSGFYDSLGATLIQIADLGERLDPGSVVPAGECPECGCFAYLEQVSP